MSYYQPVSTYVDKEPEQVIYYSLSTDCHYFNVNAINFHELPSDAVQQTKEEMDAMAIGSITEEA